MKRTASIDNRWIPKQKMSEEEILREENPAVKDAWEKYQIVLKLNLKNGVETALEQLVRQTEEKMKLMRALAGLK